MKKLVCLLLAGAMFASITGCGAGTAKETTAAETTTMEETTEARKEPETLGEALLYDFEDRVAENADATAQELAEGILTNELLLFQGGAMPVEEGFLTGFDNVEVTGFEEGVMFAPMIGTIPFVGYVFDTADAESAEALVTVLTENANPRWNICTEAEETISGTVEDKVFFVMCPKSLEE
ncbi:MAG: hypothetical protein IJ374_08280 [Lachnospiraceae bacterium]|nr:hypothetical protein [Lachnospiraceae bacterium]